MRANVLSAPKVTPWVSLTEVMPLLPKSTAHVVQRHLAREILGVGRVHRNGDGAAVGDEENLGDQLRAADRLTGGADDLIGNGRDGPDRSGRARSVFPWAAGRSMRPLRIPDRQRRMKSAWMVPPRSCRSDVMRMSGVYANPMLSRG